MRTKRHIISILLNILIVLFVVIGIIVVMVPKRSSGGTGLTARGLQNLRYFTFLSNLFCGVVAALWLIAKKRGKHFSPLLKLMAAGSVALTFSVVAFVLAPMNPKLNLYRGGNF